MPPDIAIIAALADFSYFADASMLYYFTLFLQFTPLMMPLCFSSLSG